MMQLDEIERLAERVIDKYATSFPINPHEIAKKVNIKTFFDSYQEYFWGNTVYIDKTFLILLNKDKLTNIDYAQTRYTYAHELGHYFLEKHRNSIKQGYSLAFAQNHITDIEIEEMESEANQFAASLLMPRTKVIEYFSKVNSPNFSTILDLKNVFKVSITSALVRFNKLNIYPCITISWNEQGGILKGGANSKFLDIINNEFTFIIKVNPDRPIIDEEEIYCEKYNLTYKRAFTLLSSWVIKVPEHLKDFLIIEETLNFKYGNITLLRPAQ